MFSGQLHLMAKNVAKGENPRDSSVVLTELTNVLLEKLSMENTKLRGGTKSKKNKKVLLTMNRNKWLSFTLIALLTLLLTNIVYAKNLRVAIASGYAPVAFQEKGKISGIEVDLAQQIARLSGLSLQLIEMPWQDLEQALNTEGT